MSKPFNPAAFRAEVIRRIGDAIRPHEVKTEAEMNETIEALVIVAATSFMRLRGIPYTQEAVVAFAQAAVDGMERQAALERN